MPSGSTGKLVRGPGSSGGPVVGTIENFRTTATSIPGRVTEVVKQFLLFLQDVASPEIVTDAITTAFERALDAIQKALSDIYGYAKNAYDAFNFEKLVESISRMILRSIQSILKVTNDVRNSEAVRKANEYIENKVSDFKLWTKSFSEQSTSANPPAVVNPTFDAGTKLNATSKRPRTSEGSVSRQKELEEKIRILRAELSAALDELIRHYNPRIPNQT